MGHIHIHVDDERGAVLRSLSTILSAAERVDLVGVTQRGIGGMFRTIGGLAARDVHLVDRGLSVPHSRNATRYIAFCLDGGDANMVRSLLLTAKPAAPVEVTAESLLCHRIEACLELGSRHCYVFRRGDVLETVYADGTSRPATAVEHSQAAAFWALLDELAAAPDLAGRMRALGFTADASGLIRVERLGNGFEIHVGRADALTAA